MKLRRFEGKRALVTGASRGIGSGVAQRLAAEGADVALVARTLDPRDDIAGSLRETATRLAGYGTKVATVVADLTAETSRAGVVPEAESSLGGPIDILVNNAAAALYEPVATMSLKRRRLVFEANVHAPLDLAQAVIPGMRSAGEGWIVNITSRTSQPWDGPPFQLGPRGTTLTAYGASKGALTRITNGLGAELHGSGIRVNAVEPRAAVMSEGADRLVGATIDPAKVESLEAMVEAVVALCGCPTDVTGQAFVSLDLLADWALAVHDLDGSRR